MERKAELFYFFFLGSKSFPQSVSSSVGKKRKRKKKKISKPALTWFFVASVKTHMQNEARTKLVSGISPSKR